MDRALTRLRDPSDPAIRELAAMVVRDTTSTPIAQIASPQWVASQIKAVVEAATRDRSVVEALARRIEAGREAWGDDPRILADLWPPEVDVAARQVLQQKWTPSADLTFRLLDQPAMRALVADVLTSVLTRFRAKLQPADGGLLKGVGERAARRGRGLFGGVAGNLGNLASGVVGAVREEFESGLDEMVKDFVAKSTRDVLRRVADHMADSRHEEAFAELRVGAMDVLLETELSELTAEFERLRPAELAELALTMLAVTVASEDFMERAEAAIARAFEEAGDGTLGAWLGEVGLAEVWDRTTTDLVEDRLRAVVRSDEFSRWWADLHA